MGTQGTQAEHTPAGLVPLVGQFQALQPAPQALRHAVCALQASKGNSACSAWQAGSQWGQFTPRLLRLKPEDVSKMHGGALHRARFARQVSRCTK